MPRKICIKQHDITWAAAQPASPPSRGFTT
jgi:hypothetical protein